MELRMNKPSVYVTRRIPQPAIDLLTTCCKVEVNPYDRVLTRAELVETVRGRHAVLCLLTDQIDDAIFKAAGGQCKIFANYAVGYNNIDLNAATQRGIMISNTPGVLDDATADLAWALLFSAARRITEADLFTREGQFRGWAPMLYLGLDITGKTLGVIGAGRIGVNFARKAKAFAMNILYADVKRNRDLESETGAHFVELATLLKEADFVSLHVPLLPDTTHLIGEQELRLMKKSAILINTSRGPVVHEQALVDALKSGEIWGAGLDVYEEEPQIHRELPGLKNVVLLPHIASATIETRTNMGLIAARNILQALRGERPENCLNPEVLK
jgi:glyoxylate reductase